MSRPVTTAGQRLLASAWMLGVDQPPMLDMIQAIEAEMVNRLTAAHVATHPADARPVFIKRLTMAPPGSLVYHEPGYHFEYTDCGLVTFHQEGEPGDIHWVNEMVAVRRDTAALIGRPCARCRWTL